MWTARRALDERTEYCQLGAHRWRAAYRGFVSLAAERQDPRDAQSNLGEAFGVLLANLIRTSHRPVAADEARVVAEQHPATAAVAVLRTRPRKGSARQAAGI